jgi:hypothetical protein
LDPHTIGDVDVISSDCGGSDIAVAVSFSGSDGDVSKSARSVVSDSDGNESDIVKYAVVTNSESDDSDIIGCVFVSKSYVVSPNNAGVVYLIISLDAVVTNSDSDIIERVCVSNSYCMWSLIPMAMSLIV